MSEAKTFYELLPIEKFNPYHDRLGMFARAGNAASFTIRTKDPSKQHWADMAVAREKEKNSASQSVVAKPPKKKTTLPKEEKPSSNNQGKSTLSQKTLDKCKEVEAKSVKRKTEKMTVIDDDGNILFEKSGGRGSVRFSIADAMQMNGKTVTHNHPGEFGGTFSGADINVFTKYNLRSIRAVAKEGTYSIETTSKVTSSGSKEFANEFSKRSNAVNQQLKANHSRLSPKVRNGELSVDDANKQLREKRTALCNEQHEFLKNNAEKYGYRYSFEPNTGGVAKMFLDVLKEYKDDNEQVDSDTISLDGEFINGDNWMIK